MIVAFEKFSLYSTLLNIGITEFKKIYANPLKYYNKEYNQPE